MSRLGLGTAGRAGAFQVGGEAGAVTFIYVRIQNAGKNSTAHPGGSEALLKSANEIRNKTKLF